MQPDHIAHYRIAAKIGEGGMGAVYRATDTKLNREVAIKVLPPAFSADAQRMARFQREAQLLASLNHPNIATIYGIEDNALIMELVPGPTLEQHLAAGPIPLQEIIEIARQIAEGLEAAHERGVVHRDLKPANIKLPPDAPVKLLDFGLAKATGDSAITQSDSDSPTMSLAMTQSGMIMGTAGYMSPEQAAGKTVDKRADVWSFGVVLFEMCTGKRLFAGETIAHTLADVLRADVDLTQLPSTTPPALRTIIARCLERSAKKRLRDIGEARILLESTPQPAAPPTPRGNQPFTWLPWAIAACAVLVAAIGWYRASRPAPQPPLIRVTDELAADLHLPFPSSYSFLAISPDGTRIVVSLLGPNGKTNLYTRQLAQSKLTLLPGTEEGQNPFFSPDGQWIAFNVLFKLKKISVDGGTSVTICEEQNLRGASWGDDGNIVLSIGTNSPLSVVSSNGGPIRQLTKLSAQETSHRWPHVLPGSKAVLFNVNTGTDPNDSNIEAISLPGGQQKTVMKGGFSPTYFAGPGGTGHLLYINKSTLYAAPFSPASLSLTGPAVALLEEVSNNNFIGGNFSLSASGTLALLPGREQMTPTKLMLLDGAGIQKPLLNSPGGYTTPRLSPDAKRLAYASGVGRNLDIWVKDLDRDTPTRLTFLPGTNFVPVWTPDGKYILFTSMLSNNPGVYYIRADGAGEPRLLLRGQQTRTVFSVSPDGKHLAFDMPKKGADRDIFVADLTVEGNQLSVGEPKLFVGTAAVEGSPVFSPDGRRIAYESNESGMTEVYVRPFPGPGGRWLISAAGGRSPRWSPDGRELMFVDRNHRIMAARITANGDSFNSSKPRLWSDAKTAPTIGSGRFDILPDGKHVIAILPDEDEDKKPYNHLTLLFNFGAEIRRKSP